MEILALIIILIPIEPDTLEVLLKKNTIALLPQFATRIKINDIVP